MRTIVTTVVIAVLSVATFQHSSRANPVGGTVVGGDANATIFGQGTALTIINQTANRIVINWQDFSVGPGEITRFIQPSATASALNRVISGNPSLIYGSIQANGRVFVINPNGILVGPSGQIDTKGFVASTRDVPNISFMTGGNLVFSGDSAAAIRNEGAIQALGGDVFMIANSVENYGSISAPQGTVGLAAGDQVQLVQSGNERMSVLAGGSAGTATAVGVNNAGTIEAVSAELKAAGGNIYALAVNNGGVVRATGIVNENGRIYLRASGGNIQNSGTLSAHNADGSGGTIALDGGHNATAPATVINSGTIEARGDAAGTKGGQVEVLGDHVGLFESALVDVSGDAGGGEALIGGDFQGNNAAIQNAQRTIVGSDAQIRADAISQGDGGKVIIWADELTRYYGSLSARGGALGGNGGFAEVSGHDSLVYRGSADLQSPLGEVGTLLLDPKFIVIANGGSAPVASNDDFAENANGTSTISPSDLVTALNAASVSLRANTDITITDAVDASGNGNVNDLTLQAGRSILDNANITLRGAFSATFNDGAATAANRDPGAAVFSMSGSTTITAPGGITIQGGNLAADSSGATSIAANTGDVQIQNLDSRGPTVGASANGINGGAVLVNNNLGAGDNITISGSITTQGSDGNGPSGNHAGGDGGNVTVNAGGALSVSGITTTGGNSFGTPTGGNAGTVNLTGVNGITLNNDIIALGGTGSPNGANGNQTFNNAVTLGGNATLTGGTIAFGSTINGAGNLVVNSVGAPTFGGAIGGVTALAGFTVNSAAAFTFNQNITAGSVSLWAGNDGGGNLVLDTITVRADSQSYRAGDGTGGGGAGASVDLTANNPTFLRSDGLDDPATFVYRQDAGILAVDIPAVVPTTSLTIQSDEGGVVLPALTLPGDLVVTAGGGNITDNAALAVSGNAAFTTGSAGDDITLNDGLNVAGSVSLNTVGVGGDATVNNTPAITLAASNVGGDLSVTTTAGGINDSGNLTVGVNSSFTAPAGQSIILDSAGNAFNGTVSFVGGGGNLQNVTVVNTLALNLLALTLTGNLNVTAGGAITDGGNLIIAGTTTLAAGSGNNITLNNNNDFSTVLVTSGNDVTLNDVNAINLGNLTVSGLLNVVAGGLVDFVGAAASTVGGNMGITTTAGGITDSGAGTLAVTGTSTLAAGAANNITLDNNNNFGTVAVSSGNNVTLNDANAINLGNLTVAGNLALTAAGLVDFVGAGASTVGGTLGITTTAGGINDSGSGTLAVTGASTLAAGAGNNVTLDNNNNFSTVTVTSGNDVTLRDANAINLGNMTVGGLLSVTAGGLVDFIGAGASTVGGTLGITTTAGGITDSGAGTLTVTSSSTLAAGAANDITLDNNNDFTAVGITSGDDVTLNDVSSIRLGASTVSGTLNVTAQGTIDQNGALTVTSGASTFTVNTAVGVDVLLGTQDNHFGNQTVTFNAINGGSIRDISLRNVDANASFQALPAGLRNLTVQFPNSAMDVPTLTLSGNLDLTAGGLVDFAGAGATTVAGTLGVTTTAGGIDDSGAGTLAVTGTSTLSAGSGNNITLNNNHDFSTVLVTSGNNVTLNDVNALTLGASTISGNLNLSANGLISDTGDLTVNGATTLAAGVANNIILDNLNNFVGAVSVTSGNLVRLNDINAITLGASTISGDLGVSAVGLISDAGNLTVNGATTLSAGTANDITLDNANNFVGAVTINSGNNVTLNDVNAITLGASTVSGNLAVTANGLISDSGAVSVNGTTTLAAGAANDITLNDLNNFAGAVSITSGRNVTLNDVNALVLGQSTVSGTFGATAGGNISQTGPLTISSGASTFTINGVVADVLLGSQANHFGAQTVTINAIGGGSVRDVSLRNVDGGAVFPTLPPTGLRNLTLVYDVASINLPPLSLSGTLSLTSGGQITQTGAFNASALQATAAGPVILNLANQVTTIAGSVTGAGNSFTLTDVNPITVGTVDGVNGITTVNGNVTLTADAMDIAEQIDTGAAKLATVLLQPFSFGLDMNLGTPEVAGRLSLTQDELDQVRANVLQVGNTTAGTPFGANTVVKPATVNQLVLVGSGGTIQVLSEQLAGLLAGTIIPIPKLNVSTFSSASLDAEAAAKILPPGSIGVLFLQVPFVSGDEVNYKVEDFSKWTGGRMAALGTTTGPQSPR